MNEPVKIELFLEKADVEKLFALAGGKEHTQEHTQEILAEELSAYLSKMVRRLYAYHAAFGRDLNLENMLVTAQALENKNQAYQATIDELQRRLKQLVHRHQELLATVEYLRGVPVDVHGTRHTLQ